MFALQEISQIESEMCSYLEWQLNVDLSILRDFEGRRTAILLTPVPTFSSSSPAFSLSLQLLHLNTVV